MKKILFGITSLTLGGAERVLVDIVNKLCDTYDITIFTIYSNGELEKQLSSKIKLKHLYNKSYLELKPKERKKISIKLLLNKKSIYKKYIKENYDVEIAFLEGPVTRLFSVKNEETKKIAWIHNDISLVFGNGLKAKIKKKLDEKIYSKYKTIVFVSKDNFKKFNKVYKDNIRDEYLKPVKKEIIYNYIDNKNVIEKSNKNCDLNFDNEQINFLTVARLVPQKAIDRIIKVHSKLIKNGFNHNFYIIGDGPERQNLEKLIKENKLEQTFHLLGKKENPYPYMKKADYLCLLSEFEGYGMVLEEAKILGKSIIITNTAAREAVEKYENSIILDNNEDAIYNGLKEVIVKSKENNKEYISGEQYDNSKIIDKIIKIIDGEM